MQDDISFLVQETLLNASRSAQAGFRFDESFSLGDTCSPPPECAGFFYTLKQTSTLFVLRVFSCENLAEEFQHILNTPHKYPSLKLSEYDDVATNLHFFACDGLELAEKLKQQFANKRFPVFEERILNVSDPGDSWWLDTTTDSFRLNFKLSHTNEIKKLIKLGPLGDSSDCAKIFAELTGYFQMLFPVENFSSTASEFRLKCRDSNHPLFAAFIEILKTGETSFNFWESLREIEIKYQDSEFISSIKEANQFIMELSQKRAFWLEVTELLS